MNRKGYLLVFTTVVWQKEGFFRLIPKLIKMKVLVTCCVLLFTTVLSVAQTVPWNYVPTSFSHTINTSAANITVDNTPIVSGDAVGVFYDSVGYLACGGNIIWPNSQFTAFGDDNGTPNGFSAAGFGEPFKFKVWKKDENCIVDSGSMIQFQYLPPTFNDSIFFKVNGTSKLITLSGARKYVYYAKDFYCLGDPDPMPIKSTIPDLVFSSQPGLVINPATGQINIAASQPGTYTIYFTTSLCLKSKSFQVRIKLNTDLLEVQTTSSTCTENGTVQINESSILCGTPPYQYRLRNILNGQEITSSSSSISEIPDASYELYIKDATGAESKWMNNIEITKICKDLIISPNSTNPQFTSYYIPYEGKARIYDRFGLLKKELSIPGNWDATDNSGNIVPMGQYVIICNEEKQIVVSVIK